MKKIPTASILTNAFLLPFSRLELYSQVLAIPTLLMVLAYAFSFTSLLENLLIKIIFYIVYIIAMAYFIVTCHRLVLVNSRDPSIILKPGLYTISRFLVYFIVIYSVASFVGAVIGMLYLYTVGNIYSPLLEPDGGISEVRQTTYISYLPTMYIIGRFCMVFPATALGYRVGLKWSWNATKRHGLQILFIVGIFPLALKILTDFIHRDNSTIVEQTLITILLYLFSAVGIFALSLTYKELKLNADEEAKLHY